MSYSNIDEKNLTYHVHTFGCQMNVHDSERISGILTDSGYEESSNSEYADVIVFNTCAIRENADNKLYGHLSHLVNRKKQNPNMLIAVGGCLAQKDKNTILKKAPWVDVVFGTHNIDALPMLLKRSINEKSSQIEIIDSLRTFPSNLPTKRESFYSSLVSISVGCNNTCTFCIVPSLRGKEVDRSPNEIIEEVRHLVNDGVIEITLLGQNVNAYGMSFEDQTLGRDRFAFSKLLKECGKIEGLKRVRFSSPHPAEFTTDVIEAMATTNNICPSLHMPLQSGSDRILKLMKRSYRQSKFLNIIQEVRNMIPHAAITTDIIVGFPGETDEDFEETLKVVNEARFANAYTFHYSPRPGTKAAEMDNQVPYDVVAERYNRLLELQESIAYEDNQKLIGSEVELLVSDYINSKHKDNDRRTGRSFDGRIVHFAHNGIEIETGDIVKTIITDAKKHYLIADSSIKSLIKYERNVGSCTITPNVKSPKVSLGMPLVMISEGR